MPGLDGTGPMGMGPGTGWGRGMCYGYAPYGGPGYFGGWGRGRGWGRGLGRGAGWGPGYGRGMGRGFRRRFWAGGAPAWGPGWYGPAQAPGWYGPGAWEPPTREEEVEELKQHAEMLRGEMIAVQRRIDELAGESGGES
jgi:hypothetical protein